ncbi:hypothetical protein A2239_04575 [Candidatus Uhrbacteria bacterium RIFOXYA2_FULL_40_9]|nr:MAG: hypothetical protein A2239_04575 [Candidatus Uhrbacteria bacterium RIFOXYA2_FULL_40_9]OGL97255.1 MAG: hypothetical protein A2332_01550 [Candidatus Uhrbacteria bacterium RIFOXYB2_FULL_41_18]HCB55421.1 hypothetical protein [Candidatus Uhrbacteria bacterium]
MMRFLLVFCGMLLCCPFFVHASTADLFIDSEGISFSDEFIAGDQVRIYARVFNVGDIDVSGYVLFYQGSVPIGRSQAISVRANGSPEEVYVDFIVPTGTFNIRAVLQGTDPVDTNSSNDTAITGVYTPVLDDDHDGIINSEDNCPTIGNFDQTDTDENGQGDLCDEDDDGDGVIDELDVYPLDSTKSEELVKEELLEQEVPQEEAIVQPLVQVTPLSQLVEQVSQHISDTIESVTNEIIEIETKELSEPLIFSTNAFFTYHQESWNSFQFEIISPVESGVRYEWDFGDGVQSQKTSVLHSYHGYGPFTIILKATDNGMVLSEDQTTIYIPFFSLENRWIQVSIAVLLLFLLIGVSILVRLRTRAKLLFAIKEARSSETTSKRISVRTQDE